MKKLRQFKSKIIMFIFALILPLSATGVAYLASNVQDANANNASTNYYTGYMKEVSLTNNNFNSSTSTYSLSTSLSGWTGQVSNKKSTAGIINVGNTFQNYMTGTYRLSQNPGAKATDKQILMINSKYENSGDLSNSRQGYKSSSISLSANGYYSFQVSFKSDTNYESTTDYVEQGKLGTGEDVTISADSFKGKAFNEYISFTFQNKTFYLHKQLNTADKTSEEKVLAKTDILYEDDDYIGYLDATDETKMLFVEKLEENKDGDNYKVYADTQTYTTNFKYNKTNKNWTAPGKTDSAEGTTYYLAKTTYNPLNYYSYGSIYLNGLKDKDGKPVKAEYVKVSSKEWVTFYFFVATGDESQTVSLDLWLGSQTVGQNSSGTVFFDDVHVYQYSENTFWKLYNNYFGRNYTQSYNNGSEEVTEVVDCVNLVDLRNHQTIDYPTHNFNFEAGEYQANGNPVKNWTTNGTGNARVFNTNSPQAFKTATGYDYVGSTLSCDVTLDEDLKPTIDAHNYVLGLWANGQHVEVKSNDIAIESNEILKIKAYYKVSEISNGKLYMSIEENDNIYTAYEINENHYTLTDKKYSSGSSSNGSNNFINNYGTIEFFVKAGAHYDSSFNITLGLGKTDENATGCVIIDNVTVEKATTSDYESATNKVEFNSLTGETSMPNGNFNKVTVDEDDNDLHLPQNWTITGESNALNFGGVINTEASKYNKYKALYAEYAAKVDSEYDNPYAWAFSPNPKNFENDDSVPDNVLMLANLKPSYQQLKSETKTLEAGKVSKIAFNFKTETTNDATITVYGSDGFKIFETTTGTNGVWKTYEIYLNAIAGANDIYLTIDFGTNENKVEGYAYFDNFTLEKDALTTEEFKTKLDSAEGNEDVFGVIDMSDLYLNLPSNNITTEINKDATPAYTPSLGSKDDGVIIEGGIVKSEKFDTTSKFYIEGAQEENVFFITSTGKGSYSIDSNFNLDLKADNYYKLTFKLKTNFAYTNEGIDLDADKEYEYGTTVGLTGFDYATGLVSNDEYKTYTIHIKPSEAKTTQLHISLICDAPETAGSVAIYDINLEELSEEDGKDAYDAAKENAEEKDYDVNENTEFVANASNSDDKPEDDTTNDDKNNENTNSTNNDLNWSILISSIITGAAIVIAVIGFALSKVKLKKIERKKKESYDRKTSLNVDIIKQKARNQRDAEVAEVKKTADNFAKELENLEKAHKQRVVELREKDKGKVSKETDREFKHFAQKRTVIAEKLASLNKQIDNLQSPEYLLNLERKVYVQEEAKRKELAKLSKREYSSKSNKKGK